MLLITISTKPENKEPSCSTSKIPRTRCKLPGSTYPTPSKESSWNHPLVKFPGMIYTRACPHVNLYLRLNRSVFRRVLSSRPEPSLGWPSYPQRVIALWASWARLNLGLVNYSRCLATRCLWDSSVGVQPLSSDFRRRDSVVVKRVAMENAVGLSRWHRQPWKISFPTWTLPPSPFYPPAAPSPISPPNRSCST